MKFNVGIYIRLSKEDKDNIISESVKNQKSLLSQYVKENNLNVFDFYIDDGYSGTNFNRPEFKRLISDIELKKVNMVITKDMSRLGRDYIETCNLIEKYFPTNGVRYVAITDNIDTYLDNTNNEMTPFKAIINDYYARDISKKIRSSLLAKKKEGKWVSGRCPFGYEIDAKNKNHLVINNEKAIIVKEIYEMFLKGISFYGITKILNENDIKTPSEYYEFNWNKYCKLKKKWNTKTIKDILTNEIYIGNLVQNKRNKINYKINKVVYNSRDKFIIVENTHDAIIDKDTFYRVQELLPKSKNRCDKIEKHLLDGLIYCGDCHSRILINSRRKRDGKCYIICSGYRKDKNCTVHSNNYDKLEKNIIDKLYDFINSNININKIKEKVIFKINSLKKCDCVFNKKNIDKEILILKDNLDRIYLDKINNLIDDSQYKRLKDKILNRITFYENKLTKCNYTNDDIYCDIDNYLSKVFDNFVISRELVLEVIDKIYVYEDKRVDIVLNIRNVNT